MSSLIHIIPFKANKCLCFQSKKWERGLAKNGKDDIISPTSANGRKVLGGNCEQKGVRLLENYIKAVLYGYPTLLTVSEEYGTHIRNRAILSYKSRLNAEGLAEYLAEEILRKKRLEWLRDRIEAVLEKLDEEERALVEIRYFGRRKRLSVLLPKKDSAEVRRYFRRQQRLGQKLSGMLRVAGVTEEVFLKEYAPLEEFKKIWRFVKEGKDARLFTEEERWIQA